MFSLLFGVVRQGRMYMTQDESRILNSVFMQELCRNALLPGSLADEQYFLLIRLSSIRCDEGYSRYEGLPSGRAFAQTDM